jgi:hypothetical protein
MSEVILDLQRLAETDPPTMPFAGAEACACDSSGCALCSYTCASCTVDDR